MGVGVGIIVGVGVGVRPAVAWRYHTANTQCTSTSIIVFDAVGVLLYSLPQ